MRRHFQGALGTDSSGIPYIVLGEDWYFDFSPPEMLRHRLHKIPRCCPR